MNKMIRTLCVTSAAAVAVAGCGDDEQPAATVTEERTVIQRAPQPEPKTVTVRAPKPQPKRRSRPKPAAARLITVPDVVGENHQYAQDEMQAAGLYSLDERDASGEGRVLLWDRNWMVVSQDPPAGSRVSRDTTVTLTSRHEDD